MFANIIDIISNVNYNKITNILKRNYDNSKSFMNLLMKNGYIKD